jgi:hypothetical protein
MNRSIDSHQAPARHPLLCHSVKDHFLARSAKRPQGHLWTNQQPISLGIEICSQGLPQVQVLLPRDAAPLPAVGHCGACGAAQQAVASSPPIHRAMPWACCTAHTNEGLHRSLRARKLSYTNSAVPTPGAWRCLLLPSIPHSLMA